MLRRERKKNTISSLCPLQPIGVTGVGSIARLSEFQFQLHYFLFSFLAAQQHMKVPRPGTESETQVQPVPQLQQCWILNLLCNSGNSSLLFFFFFMATPVAHGRWGQGLNRSCSFGPEHSHSNTRTATPGLTLQPVAMPGPRSRGRAGMEPSSSQRQD